MKRGLWIFILAVLAGCVGFFIVQKHCWIVPTSNAVPQDGISMLPELRWLHDELKLSNEQFARVSELHIAYRPTCEALCMKVISSRRKVRDVIKNANHTAAELDAALQEQASVRMECQRALLKHLNQTAAVMSPEQARQYLDAMLPQVVGTDAEPRAEDQ